MRLSDQLRDVVFVGLGLLAVLAGDLAGARQRFTECVEVCRRTRNRVSLADWLLRLGAVHLYQGEPGPARAALQESLALAEDIAKSFPTS